jgi:hypothetical protein
LSFVFVFVFVLVILFFSSSFLSRTVPTSFCSNLDLSYIVLYCLVLCFCIALPYLVLSFLSCLVCFVPYVFSSWTHYTCQRYGLDSNYDASTTRSLTTFLMATAIILYDMTHEVVFVLMLAMSSLVYRIFIVACVVSFYCVSSSLVSFCIVLFLTFLHFYIFTFLHFYIFTFLHLYIYIFV